MNNTTKNPRIALHMMMNDSATTLLEWVTHHHRAGFDNITVHSDGANEPADTLGEKLHSIGLINFLKTDYRGNDKKTLRHTHALDASLQHALQDNIDYLLWLEPQDFICINVGKNSIADLFEALDQKPDFLSLTQQMAGSSGHVAYEPKLVIERFRRGAGNAIGETILATGIRTLLDPRLVKQVKIARPQLKNKYKNGQEKVVWLDGAGKSTGDRYLKSGWKAPHDAPGFGLAHIVTYAIQDRETWLLRNLETAASFPFVLADSLRTAVYYFNRLNFNFETITCFDAVASELQMACRDLLSRHPDLGRAQQAVIDEFSSRTSLLLAQQSEAARNAILSFLAGSTPSSETLSWDAPVGVETTRPGLSEKDSAWTARLQSHHQVDAADDNRRWASSGEAAESADDAKNTHHKHDSRQVLEVSEAPRWLGDLRLSQHSHGFYQSIPNYACVYVARNPDNLLVSFDNLASARENPVARQPWGYEFVQKSGWSHLGIMSFVPGWFRSKELHQYLISLKQSGFFSQFRSVTMFGTSMGAYGAAAFSSLAPNCRVAAFSPQSTLSTQLAPWDFRYPAGRRSDWSGDFVDAAVEIRQAEKMWLFFDPNVMNDRRHAERFTSNNVVRVPLRYADHKTALILRQGNVLSKVMREIVTGTATFTGMMRHYRSCRKTGEFRAGVRVRAQISGGEHRAQLIDRIYEHDQFR